MYVWYDLVAVGFIQTLVLKAQTCSPAAKNESWRRWAFTWQANCRHGKTTARCPLGSGLRRQWRETADPHADGCRGWRRWLESVGRAAGARVGRGNFRGASHVFLAHTPIYTRRRHPPRRTATGLGRVQSSACGRVSSRQWPSNVFRGWGLRNLTWKEGKLNKCQQRGASAVCVWSGPVHKLGNQDFK